MTESKAELEKSLKLSRKLRKELNSLTEWLAATDAELTRRSAVSGVPEELEAEVAWAQVPPEHTCTHACAAAPEQESSVTEGCALLMTQKNVTALQRAQLPVRLQPERGSLSFCDITKR